jgi:iron complex transport system permease protein
VIAQGVPRPTAVASATTGPVLIVALAVLALGAALAAVCIGAVSIPISEVVRILAKRLLGIGPGASSVEADLVLWTIRLPRVALALLVGAALGVSGAALQGIFRNPLADPGLIGVSSGGAVGAVGAIVLGFNALGLWSIPIAAFVGSLITTAGVFVLSFRNGRVEMVTLVLCGVAVNAIAGSGIGLLTAMATDAELRDVSFWQLGSVGGARWESVGAVAPFAAAALIALPRMARSLDLFVICEREARHLGVNVERTRALVIISAASACGAAVAVAGILGFVGLIVPHLVRLVHGPRHRVLLPASALGGAALLTAADLCARTIADPREIPLGVLTALLGAPVFLVLIHRTRLRSGGFA